MQLTHLGHACVLIESSGQRILIDPGAWSDYSGIGAIDAVFVTHQHPDHLDPKGFGDLLKSNPQAQAFLEPQSLEAATKGMDSGERLERLVSGESYDIGGVTVAGVGDKHAQINDYIPLIDNVGVVLSADSEPALFHPGDALDADPGNVDLLCVPVNAPWGRAADAIEFVRRIEPARVIPIHDGLLNELGRGLYLKQIGDFGLDGGVEVLDLRGAGTTEV